jgi:hypothetical protein
MSDVESRWFRVVDEGERYPYIEIDFDGDWQDWSMSNGTFRLMISEGRLEELRRWLKEPST